MRTHVSKRRRLGFVSVYLVWFVVGGCLLLGGGELVWGGCHYTVSPTMTDTETMGLPEPSEVLVINHKAMTEFEPGRAVPLDTRSAWLKQGEDTITYCIGEQNRRVAWTLELPLEIDVERYSILRFKYRLNSAAVDKYWAFWGHVVGKRNDREGLYMLDHKDLIADDQVHVIEVDLRTIKRNVKLDELAIAFRATGKQMPAELEVFEISFRRAVDSKAGRVFEKGDVKTFLLTDEAGLPIEGGYAALNYEILNLQSGAWSDEQGMARVVPWMIDDAGYEGQFYGNGKFATPIVYMDAAPRYEKDGEAIYPVTLFENKVFKGRVVNDANEGIANAAVRIEITYNKSVFHRPRMTTAWDFFAYTNEDGWFEYELPWRLVKTVKVEVDHNAYQGQVARGNVKGRLLAGDYVVRLDAEKHLTGFVFDAESGEPMVGAKVERKVSAKVFNPTDFTDEHGYFSFPMSDKRDNVKFGKHEIVVSKAGVGETVYVYEGAKGVMPGEEIVISGRKMVDLQPMVQWKDAESDPVRIYLPADGVKSEGQPLHLAVEGEVVDVETGRAVKVREVGVGMVNPEDGQIYWQANRLSKSKLNGSRFSLEIENPTLRYVIGIRAKGYADYWSEPISIGDDGLKGGKLKLKVKMVRD
ncbi:hypothetical protein KS4_05030 [Poriferisphaera corsica]|uniref:Uncharacterized protein n=1 Tax=Poriferisphaera corsica TaxID=2528020 RepID=A0A517YQI7_9BACT|nr:carboxypeptidase-like regulatory domain-containing protein [Poriferisphaera corsica]QDU32471.1 hypothetical protein KS4_05030 [Poriferisphaera corsica]